MKLINLDHCANSNNDLIKKSSLFFFLKNNNDFDKEKLKFSLDVNEEVLDEWMSEFELIGSNNKSKEMFLLMVDSGAKINYAKIARDIGVTRVTLYNWKKKYKSINKQ